MKKIIFAFGLLFVFSFVYLSINKKTTLEEKYFIVEPRQSFLSIIDDLHSEGIIKNRYFFKVFVFLRGSHRDFKPGEYYFNGSYSMKNILEELKNNKGISVTIVEGYNIYQIEKLLLKNEILSSKGELVDFLVKDVDLKKYPFLRYVPPENNLEGFLYPNTYYFLKNTSIERVVENFLDHFNENIYILVKDKIALDEFYYKLIKASFLEKEIYHKEDMPLALSVINNRLDIGMRLQIDATLCYPKFMLQYEKDQVLRCNQVLASDKQMTSEYNTYRYAGLTRTPISNVNFETFKTVLEEITSDYFYYITTPQEKDTVFGKTLEEHNRNIQKYLR